MHTGVADRKDEIAALCRRHRVLRLELFGSAARGTDFDPETSDADFLVEFEPTGRPDRLDRLMGLEEDLAEALGRKVDLVETGAIRNPYLLASIERDREPVYAA